MPSINKKNTSSVLDLQVEIIPAPTGPSDRITRFSRTSSAARGTAAFKTACIKQIKSMGEDPENLLIRDDLRECLMNHMDKNDPGFTLCGECMTRIKGSWDDDECMCAPCKINYDLEMQPKTGPGDMLPVPNLSEFLAVERALAQGMFPHSNPKPVLRADAPIWTPEFGEPLPEGFTYSTPGPCQDCGTEPVWMKNFERWNVVDDLCENCYKDDKYNTE